MLSSVSSSRLKPEPEVQTAAEPQEETEAPIEEAEKIILNEDDTQEVDE